MFEKVKKNFGFGCMRLPMNGNEVDLKEFSLMVDDFLNQGFNYFDTAHGYLDGKSELALKECLTSRYPRESYILTNKLSGWHFEKEEEILPLFNEQLKACGVDYFDFYLMHAQNKNNFIKYKECRAYEIAFELKKQGKVKHVGLSFHDTADVLDNILTEYPQIEVVQIQFNYLDFNDPSIQSKKCYDVCVKHNKPVIIMEPVKGGKLVNFPNEIKELFVKANGGSPASYAIRFAASFEQVFMVLSGMSNCEQMQDNLSYMREFKPLESADYALIDKVVKKISELKTIQCTSCRYCTENCPQGILIPDMFTCYNNKKAFNDWNADRYYHETLCKKGAKASECIKCGICESVCPQKLKVRELLVEVTNLFENNE